MQPFPLTSDYGGESEKGISHRMTLHNAATRSQPDFRDDLLKKRYTVNRKKHVKMFLSYLLQYVADSDKILYTLSRIYLPQSNINVFHLN